MCDVMEWTLDLSQKTWFLVPTLLLTSYGMSEESFLFLWIPIAHLQNVRDYLMTCDIPSISVILWL